MKPSRDDTIAALATAPGQAAVAIVRLSGHLALPIACDIAHRRLRPRYAERCALRDAANDVIDSGLVLFFPAPHSYTGEDVVEFQCHGGHVVSGALLQRVNELGARAAEPGEFTLRAYLHDKLDLLRNLVSELKLAAVVVTHDLELMRKVADKVVILHKGQVIYFGPVSQLDQAQHEHIKEFLAMDRVELG